MTSFKLHNMFKNKNKNKNKQGNTWINEEIFLGVWL